MNSKTLYETVTPLKQIVLPALCAGSPASLYIDLVKKTLDSSKLWKLIYLEKEKALLGIIKRHLCPLGPQTLHLSLLLLHSSFLVKAGRKTRSLLARSARG
jgi:hypothetical protein